MSNNVFKKIISPLIISLGEKIEKNNFSKPPILIVACPRSGTTMLLSILSAHPHIHAIKRQTYTFDKWENGGQPKPLRMDRLYRELIIQKIPDSAERWLE